jgi:AraC-like DNA-binding protein
LLNFSKGTLIKVMTAGQEARIPLRALSRLFGLNYCYLSRLIKRSIGCTYSRLILKMRIEIALKYLRETRKPIKEIVVLAGYKSISHFYRNFRAIVGCTPKRFRARRGIPAIRGRSIRR